MRASKFYMYTVITANLSRVITSIEAYKLNLSSLELGEEQRTKKKDYEPDSENIEKIEEIKRTIEELKKKRAAYIEAKADIDNKYFKKYYRKYNVKN